MRRAADGLRALEVELDLLLTSPYRRAVETAEIVAASLGSVETGCYPNWRRAPTFPCCSAHCALIVISKRLVWSVTSPTSGAWLRK